MGAKPCSSVYVIEVVLLIEITTASLRVIIESQIFDLEWAKAQQRRAGHARRKRLRALPSVQL